MPGRPLTGSCHCGGLQFEIVGTPGFLSRCHCSRCRKVSGAAFHTTIGVGRADFQWKSDPADIVSYRSEPPNWIVRDFCPVCGCYVGELLSGLDPLVVSAAILDGDPGHGPVGHGWVKDAVPWYSFCDERLCFPEEIPPIEVWKDPPALAAAKTARPVFSAQRTGILPTPGSCLCGAVRYEVGALTEIATCHCVDCRKSQGGEFSTNGTATDFRILQGEESIRAYESSPGHRRCFCSICGVTVFARGDGGWTRIRFATLDADPGVSPELHVWTSQQVPWQSIPEAAETFTQGWDEPPA